VARIVVVIERIAGASDAVGFRSQQCDLVVRGRAAQERGNGAGQRADRRAVDDPVAQRTPRPGRKRYGDRRGAEQREHRALA
jgi:hypothetical protein